MKTICTLPRLALALLPFAPAIALAQQAPVSGAEPSLLGVAVRTRPAYDGSSSRRTDLVPLLRFESGPLFARSTQGVLEGGARFELSPGLKLGAQVAYEAGRKPDESRFLKGKGFADVGAGASLGLHAEWNGKLGPAPVSVLARWRQNTDSARGAQADLRATAGVYQSGPLSAGVFAQATWGNAKAVNSLYGVSAAESASSLLSAYQGGSGLMFASVGLLWSYDISNSWALLGSVEGRSLQGSASRSPLAERSSSYYLTAGLARKF